MKIAPQYKDQVGLLLDIFPIVAKKNYSLKTTESVLIFFSKNWIFSFTASIWHMVL